MIDTGIYNPVLAYCRERLRQCESIEAKAELASVIVLCEGLNRQQELLQKALFDQMGDIKLYDNR